jgi:competence protein ComEC
MDRGRWQQLTNLPLLWLSLAFLLGVALAAEASAPAWFWLAAAGLAAALAVGLRRLSQPQRGLLLFACLLSLGALRYQLAQPVFGAGDLAAFNDSDEQVVIEGVLAAPPTYHDAYVELLLRAQKLSRGGQVQAVGGLLLARADLGTDWRYGDLAQLTGELRTPAEFEDFSYRDYLARRGVYSQMSFASAVRLGEGQGNPVWAALYGLRSGGVEILHRLYPDPEAGLLAGILLGDESGIGHSLQDAFNDTGTRHIIAISGFNITIIAGLFLSAFSRWVGQRRGLWLAAAAIMLYTVLVGAEASVVRAAIMGLVALAARLLGRDQFGVNTLAFTGAVMALVNPFVLWDAGFQLSFMATLGLMTLGERLRTWSAAWLDAHASKAWAQRLKGPLYEYVLLTLSAQIFTLPLLLHYFGRLSLISLPANILILPLQPAVMIFSGLSVLAAAVLWPLGQLLSLAAWPLAAFTIRVVEAFAGPTWAAQDVGGFSLLLVLLSYVGLFVLMAPGVVSRVRSIPFRPLAPLTALAVLSVWSWGLASSNASGQLQITLLDLEGEAMLIRTPAGRNLLINGGPSAVELSAQLGRQLPLFGRDLDWLLIAGERPEQINGLMAGQARLQISQVAWASLWPSTELDILLENMAAAQIPLTELQPGQHLDLGEGVDLEVIGLGQRGATLLLTWKDFQAVLPFGLDFDQIEQLAASSFAGVDLLLLADAGYPALNPPEWIAGVDANVHWLTADGVASEDLLGALRGRTLFASAELGWLQVTTDGESMWLNAEQGASAESALMQP